MAYHSQIPQTNMAEHHQWLRHQPAQASFDIPGFDNANIDPRLLQNVGSWPNSEESHNSIATTEQVAQDVDRSVDAEMVSYRPAYTLHEC